MTTITSAFDTFCGIKDDKTVWCLGNNEYGQIGDGSITDRWTPVQVTGLSNVAKLFGGKHHFCSVLTDKTVKCWGKNDSRQLGSSQLENALVPIAIADLTNVEEMALGDQHSCALFTDNSVKCWGNNTSGELGDGEILFEKIPKKVANLTQATQVVRGESHTCALDLAGKTYCWGFNAFGQLGFGINSSSDTPAMLTDPALSAIKLQASGDQTCATQGVNDIKCWGANASTSFGAGTGPFLKSPTSITVTNDIKEFYLGSQTSCMKHANDSISCMGANTYAQLGVETKTPGSSDQPLAINLSDVKSMHLTSFHSCALMNDKTVRCWGYNYNGELGRGIFSTGSGEEASIAAVNNLTDVRDLGLNYGFSCALKENNSVWCWGWNGYGQLGDGFNQKMSEPVEVKNVKGATAISLGEYTACALLADKTVKCWGRNDKGQRGNGGVNSTTATLVAGLSDVKYLAPTGYNSDHFCAIKENGEVYCWGANDRGQLGIEKPKFRSVSGWKN